MKKYHIHSFFIFHDKIKGKTKAPYEKLSAAAGFPCRSLRKSHFWRRKEEMPVQEGHWRESQWRWRMVQWRWDATTVMHPSVFKKKWADVYCHNQRNHNSNCERKNNQPLLKLPNITETCQHTCHHSPAVQRYCL